MKKKLIRMLAFVLCFCALLSFAACGEDAPAKADDDITPPANDTPTTDEPEEPSADEPSEPDAPTEPSEPSEPDAPVEPTQPTEPREPDYDDPANQTALTLFYKALKNKITVRYTKDNRSYLLNDLYEQEIKVDFEGQRRVNSFSIEDIDADGVCEVTLGSIPDASDIEKLVLRYENDEIVVYTTTWTFLVKSGGMATFGNSGGITQYGTLKFEGGEIKQVVTAFKDSTFVNEPNKHIYTLNGQPSTKDAFDAVEKAFRENMSMATMWEFEDYAFDVKFGELITLPNEESK